VPASAVRWDNSVNFIEIRRGTQVLILARPGLLPKAARAASDRQRLPGTLARLSLDKAAMATVRAGWFNVFPSVINVPAMSDAQVARYVTDALSAKRIEAALLRNALVPLSPAEVEQMQHAFANARVQRGQIIVAQKGALPVPARAFTNPAQVVQLLGAMQDGEEGAVILDRQAGRLSAFGLGALRGRQLRNGIIAKIKAHVLDAAFIPPGSVADAAAAHPSATAGVASMGPGDKVAAALQRSLPHLSGEVQALVAEMVTPTNLAIMAGIFVAVALANTNPVTGAAVDSILLGVAWFAAGLTGVYALGDFIDATVSAIKAKTETELDEAGRTYAKALVGMGSALIQAIMARFLSKRGGTTEEGAGGARGKAAPEKGKPAPAAEPKPAEPKPAAPAKTALPPEVQKMPPDFQAKYADAEAAGWKYPPGHPEAGKTWYPPNDGAVGSPVRTNLPKDYVLDRFGGEHGSFLSAAGDSFESRALPPSSVGTPNQYVVTARGAARMTVEKAEIAPWFGEPGGGTQYRLIDAASGKSMSVTDAIANKWLTRGP
jgi:hypothetical protein